MTMKKNTLWMLATILFLCGTVSVEAQTKGKLKTSLYFSKTELPDVRVWLPAPPDVTSPLFVDDYNQWLWGKSMRPTARGKQASWESLYGIKRMETVFSEALGFEVSREKTPAIWQFMYRAGDTGHVSVSLTKQKYQRRRPFDRMNEHVWGEFDDEEDLRPNGSYPSGHTGLGWGTALALAEMAPELQDTILRRGFEYGQSRVIVGAHWQSDVNAAYLAAAAAIARMHTSPEYLADLAAARMEYCRIKGIKKKAPVNVGYPKRERVLDAPIDTASCRYYGDLAAGWLAQQERKTDRGLQAIADTACSVTAFLQGFSSCVGGQLSAEQTPAIAALVEKVFGELCTVATDSKTGYFRKRPFVQLAIPTAIPAKEESYLESSSYPSSHSLLGWGIALALVEAMPECQDAILTRGFEYGRSRMIVGYHYASDVRDGRLMASCAMPRMHNDGEFLQLMKAAQKEFATLKEKGLLAQKKAPSPASSEAFVNLTDVVPDAILEIRYYGTYNFVGTRIDGYEEPTALLTRRAADSLRAVSDDLKALGYRLKIYDAYRPQCAVDHFMRWAADVSDTLMKPYFYPDLDKKVLFPMEYICERSGHTRGSTLDLTLFDMKTEKELDMGGTFDWFGPESHPDFCGNPANLNFTADNHKSPAGRTITAEQFRNRMVLRQAMLRHGFKPFDTEWWHFTLADEPFPDTYFTFPVKRLE